jgi:hypothetical protein
LVLMGDNAALAQARAANDQPARTTAGF